MHMAAANDIELVSQSMPGVPRWEIERRLDKGEINIDNYED
jgi:hypothetical protein